MARKKKEEALKVEIQDEIIKEEPKLEVSVIYHTGDDIDKICEALTGFAYLKFRLLEVNGYNMHTLKDGAVLKWEV